MVAKTVQPIQSKVEVDSQLEKEEEPIKPISTRASTVNLFRVLRFLGIDNLNRTWWYILHSFQLNSTSFGIQVFGFTASYVVSFSKMSIGTFLTSLQVSINVYGIVPKILIMYFSMEALRRTGTILDKLDAKIKSKQERLVAENMISFCNRIVIIYIVCYWAYSTSTFLAALYNGHPPYAIYIPFLHWHESRTKMIISSFLEYYLINISCIQDVGLDVYAIVFMYMARMHMKIVCIRVEEIGKDPTKSEDDNIRTLVDCIDSHRTILEFIEIMRPIISKTVFVQLLVTACVMGITLINIMMFSNFYAAVASVIYFMALSMQTLPFCYTMNVLMDEINLLPTSILHSGWVGQTKKYRHMLGFYMQNAQKFNNIIAGNIMPIQVSTFLSIARMAFSVYALVSKMEARRRAHAA